MPLLLHQLAQGPAKRRQWHRREGPIAGLVFGPSAREVGVGLDNRGEFSMPCSQPGPVTNQSYRYIMSTVISSRSWSPGLKAHHTVNDCHIMKSWGPVTSCSSAKLEVSWLIHASCSLLSSDPSENFKGKLGANEGCGNCRSLRISVITWALRLMDSANSRRLGWSVVIAMVEMNNHCRVSQAWWETEHRKSKCRTLVMHLLDVYSHSHNILFAYRKIHNRRIQSSEDARGFGLRSFTLVVESNTCCLAHLLAWLRR